MATQADRDLSFDAFRGMAIVAVVAIHASLDGFSWDYSRADEPGFIFLVLYLQLLLFAVPALIFMSGYWSAKRPIKSLRDYKNFLARKLPRILIPYLFWSFILFGYRIIKTNDINPQRIIMGLFTGGACYPYYFIIVIAQLYIITPFIQYLNRKQYGLIFVLVLNVMSLLGLYLSRVFNVILHLPAYLPFYSWIIFYEIGLLMGNRRNRKYTPTKANRFILLAILISLLISQLEGMVLLFKFHNLDFAGTPLKYSTFLYAACVIFGFLCLRQRLSSIPKLLVTMGTYSFGIYLIHIPVIDIVAFIFQKVDMIYRFVPLYRVIVFLAAFSICYVVVDITRRLLPEPFCRRVLGF
jgi:surface polysaccharide O-acyltransferase-like enzyme